MVSSRLGRCIANLPTIPELLEAFLGWAWVQVELQMILTSHRVMLTTSLVEVAMGSKMVNNGNLSGVCMMLL